MSGRRVCPENMAGIYLHIPFCRKACHYCNFHFSTSLRAREPMVQALLAELELQRNFLQGAPLQSIYFGGGTPSLLEEGDLQRLLAKVHELHTVLPEAEITLEANPDDLSPDYLRMLKSVGINRLSIGIQSFFDEDLQFMNRAHNAGEARRCLADARAAGFHNLTADLIYGVPGADDARWQANVEYLLEAGIPHLSCYCLTVEPNTALDHFVRKKQVPPVDEEQASRQFEWLCERLQAAGYEHYEISNFALPGHRAVHNTSYWLGQPYLGLGPSAHSFDGQGRQWNVANNALYLRALEAGSIPFEREELSEAQRYNEYVLTSLRTSWGSNLSILEQRHPRFTSHFQREVLPFIQAGQVLQEGNTYRLSQEGKLLADHIASSLFAD